MSIQKAPPRIIELDPDATAELPVLEFDDGQTVSALALPESAVATDVFPAPAIPAGVADLADSLREVEQRLERKIERVNQLEADVAAAQLQIGEQQAQLGEAQRAGAARESVLRAELASAAQGNADLQRQQAILQDNLAEARTQLQSQHSALTDSQQQALHNASLQRKQERDLVEMRRCIERQHEALSTWQGFRAVSDSWLAESEAQLHGIDVRHEAALQAAESQGSRLQNELEAERQQAAARIVALERSLQEAARLQQATLADLQAAHGDVARVRAELDTSQASLDETRQQLEALRTIEGRAREGAERFDEQQQQIASLEAEISAANARYGDAEAKIRKASERVQRLEADAHASAAVLGNLQQSMQRLGRDDTGSRRAPPQPAQTVLRVLIRHEEGSDVVYPLARRTSVGRTPENDIQVDTTFISRHHAVLLSSPDHCIVEDLNSTNGVLVNGRRVTRQILHDGDSVTIGKTEFRYQQRS